MAGHEQPLACLGVAGRLGLPAQCKGRVDPAVAGNVDLAAHALASEVGGAELCRREEQLGKAVDRDPELLFRPGPPPVVASQPGLNVSDHYSGSGRRERASERARRVALNDYKCCVIAGSAPEHRLRYGRNMSVGVACALATELQFSPPGQPEPVGVEARMLARENKSRRNRALLQRMDHWRKLDGFGTRADHGDNGTGQPSP